MILPSETECIYSDFSTIVTFSIIFLSLYPLNAFKLNLTAQQTFQDQTAAFTVETFTADLNTFALQEGLTSKH